MTFVAERGLDRRVGCAVSVEDDRAGADFLADAVSKRPRLSSRLLIGGLAGLAGTMAMTAAMRRLHKKLPDKEQYPLPPREIVDSTAEQAGAKMEGEPGKDITTLAHFAYGAAVGAMIAAMNPDPKKRTGALVGGAVWIASYMGWIPAVGALEPATRHPARRNAAMIGAHFIWGATTAAAIRELRLARGTIFAAGPDPDAPPEGRKRKRR
jgi:uncharacterized membrane protein YagU involved in acid resistance